MSDSHNNRDKLRKAIELINEQKCKILIHCGDFTSPSILYEFKDFSGKVYGVFGNIDTEIGRMQKLTSTEINNLQFMGTEGTIVIEEKRIAFTHYPEIARMMAREGNYHIVFYGHTHRYNVNKISHKTLLINPGEISGRYGKSSFIFYNLSTEEIKKIDL